MKIELRRKGQTAACKLPYDQCSYVSVPNAECINDKCESRGHAFEARGYGPRERKHSTLSCASRCTTCGADAGRMVVTFGTLFGIEEDERVLNGRARVY